MNKSPEVKARLIIEIATAMYSHHERKLQQERVLQFAHLNNLRLFATGSLDWKGLVGSSQLYTVLAHRLGSEI